MSERPEPFLFERVWAHPSSRVPEDAPTATAVFDDTGRLVGVRYSDGEEESYEYDDWSHRRDRGGRLAGVARL
jgi:YD repeat-containing protein